MAMGTRKRRERQQQLWVASSDIVRTPVNAFYDRLNEILNRRDIDRRVEHWRRHYYKGSLGRPGVTSGVCFRLLLMVCFEGLDSERGSSGRLRMSVSSG